MCLPLAKQICVEIGPIEERYGEGEGEQEILGEPDGGREKERERRREREREGGMEGEREGGGVEGREGGRDRGERCRG